MLKIVTRLVLFFFTLLVYSYAAYGQESCNVVEEAYRFSAELNSTDTKVVKEVVDKLRARCPIIIRGRLKNPDERVRYAFAWAIAELRAAEFTAAMGERLRDSSDKVRNEASWFMVELKVPGYQREMSELLNDPSEKVRKEARLYMDLFGAPAASSAGEMRDALKRVLAARGNDFADFRGELVTYGQGKKHYWKSTLILPGATRCSISPKGEYSRAKFDCHLSEWPLAEADRYFDQLVASARAAMPGSWRVEDYFEGMTSSSSDKKEIRRFFAGPNLDIDNDVYVIYFFLPRWSARSSISIHIQGN